MARVSSVEMDTAPPELARTFQDSFEKFGQVSNFYLALGHAPAAVAAWQTA